MRASYSVGFSLISIGSSDKPAFSCSRPYEQIVTPSYGKMQFSFRSSIANGAGLAASASTTSSSAGVPPPPGWSESLGAPPSAPPSASPSAFYLYFSSTGVFFFMHPFAISHNLHLCFFTKHARLAFYICSKPIANNVTITLSKKIPAENQPI